MRLGYTLPESQHYFQELFKNKIQEQKSTFDVPIGGKLELKEVYEVPLDLPRYRLGNTRTIALQEKYISENGLQENYFEADPLSDTLQEIQHKLLAELIKRKGLYEFFKKTDNRQTVPLILTHEGFVISGNRRLCTFRELYYSEENGSTKYKHFERIRVVILPRLSEEEIEYIEDYFEQQPDIQDEFTWTNRALGFERRLSKHGYGVDILADKTNVKKSDIENLLSKLTVAKEYLEFIGKPRAYDLVEKDEYAFEELLKSRKKFVDDAAQKDAFQKLSFIALKRQDQISDRMYKNIPVIQETLKDILEEVSSDYSDQISNDKESSDNDPFAGLDTANDTTLSLLRIIENGENEEAIFNIVLDKVNEYKLLKEEKKRKQAVLRKIQKAHKELVEANNMTGAETKKDGISEQLDNIEKIVDQLRQWLGK